MSRGGVDAAFRRQGQRLGLPEEMINAVLSVGKDPETSSVGSGGLSPGSVDSDPLSVSVRSALFEDNYDGEQTDEGPVSSQRGNATKHLLDQLEQLRHEKKLLELDFERSQTLARNQIKAITKRHKTETQQLKDQLAKASEDLPLLRKRLDVKQHEFSDLECSASLYEDLKARAAKDWTLKELVQVKVFEMTSAQRSQIASLTEQARQATAKASESAELVEHHQHALSRVQEKYEARILMLETDLSEARQSARENREKFLESLKHNDGLHEKATSHDRIEQRCQELERDRAVALRASEQAVASAKAAEEKLAAKQSRLKAAEEQLELVKVDKAYLRRERDDKKQACLRLEQLLEHERDKVSALEHKLEKARDQATRSREAARSEYEQRLAEQVESIKSTNSRQLSALKETQLATTEREVRALTLSREEAVHEAESLRAKLSTLQSELEQARLELASQQGSQQAALADVRSQLNMRVFEAETLANSIEEKSGAVRKLELENEMLDSKLQVIKADFVALEASSSRRITELSAKVAAQEEQIGVYEALEQEIDSAVLAKAKAAAGVAQEGEKGDELPSDKVVQGLISISRTGESETDTAAASSTRLLPVSAQRRVKHSVQLAQQLVQAERLLEAAKGQTREKDAAMALLKKRLEQAEQAAAISSQPQAYLVDRLTQKERELENANARVLALEQEQAKLEAKLDQTVETRDQLHLDLKTVLAERASLERSVRDQAQRVIMRNTQTSPIKRAPIRSPKSDRGRHSDDENVVLEVDQPDESGAFGSSAMSVASMESSTFVLHKQDQDGIPLPKWYRKLRQEES